MTKEEIENLLEGVADGDISRAWAESLLRKADVLNDETASRLNEAAKEVPQKL